MTYTIRLLKSSGFGIFRNFKYIINHNFLDDVVNIINLYNHIEATIEGM